MTIKEKSWPRARWLTAAAAFAAVGLLSSGCASHNAAGAGPAAPDDRPAVPAAAPAPGAAAPSPLSKGDQDEMKQKQNENKGLTPPP